MLKQKSWIAEANNQVHISDLLISFGVSVPESVKVGADKKVHCPFGFYHSDGGQAKAMRVYGRSNTAYCFSCAKRYSPVTLAAAKWDCSWNTAAYRLLEDAGFKPKTVKERWVEATAPVENKIDLIALAEALKIYCSNISPVWSSKQYDEAVANRLNSCLNLLPSVKTENDACKWLKTCKHVMHIILE